ncbi:hypothetical protein SAMN04487895_101493 [Paenibacillus sophorae]|uniref:Uncharacterized protein n=1 Tax=Paenibacillus sophorae TaxID=1333845 RepID=A0A1H8GFR1_9BACL|nr:hypothetical protein [Paenibacillus sophorae]QWU14204.1 hypothetical protein KP014_20035 [Paenibacillus sophorae]SEN42639.1 hypothetical protein SAMN04487895_101493 [Paenibacillus sophorae]
MEILFTDTVVKNGPIAFIGSVAIIGFIVCLVFLIGSLVNKKGSVSILCFLLLVICSTAIRFTVYEDNSYTKEYKIILKDPNYVIDATKYTVIRQEGRIITIREK